MIAQTGEVGGVGGAIEADYFFRSARARLHHENAHGGRVIHYAIENKKCSF